MNELYDRLIAIKNEASIEKSVLIKEIIGYIQDAGYTIVEINDQKPWGAYIRFSADDADRFVREFFPGLSSDDARLGIKDAELSPKILLVAPSQRLSWQYHNRRAERWAFLTEGGYHKSTSDDEGAVVMAARGDGVQFVQGERHRLVGAPDTYAIVAEIWQHQDKTNPSNEEDIVRLSDDYKR